jgi:pimeloyl-ACP methyl ester carboxylesterase
VLLPGMDGSGVLFRPLLESLPERLCGQVIVFPPDRPLGYPELLPLVRAALPADHEYLLLGESFSGPLALAAAREAPPGLRGVVLSVSFLVNPIREMPRWSRHLALPPIFGLYPTALKMRAIAGRWRRHPGLEELVLEASNGLQPRVMAARARAILSVDARHDLERCPVPVLYLRGRRDRVVGRHCLELARSIRPDLRVAVLEAPHLLLQTSPREAVRELLDFADSLGES